jgi:hypothetical protein
MIYQHQPWRKTLASRRTGLFRATRYTTSTKTNLAFSQALHTLVAPGVEDSSKHGTESLVRFGAGYGFKTGGWMITPQLNVDFVDGEDVWVFGVGFGKGF